MGDHGACCSVVEGPDADVIMETPGRGDWLVPPNSRRVHRHHEQSISTRLTWAAKLLALLLEIDERASSEAGCLLLGLTTSIARDQVLVRPRTRANLQRSLGRLVSERKRAPGRTLTQQLLQQLLRKCREALPPRARSHPARRYSLRVFD